MNCVRISVELFKLADYYGEEDLKSRCEHQLKVMITNQSVLEVYSLAVQHGSKVIRY